MELRPASVNRTSLELLSLPDIDFLLASIFGLKTLGHVIFTSKKLKVRFAPFLQKLPWPRIVIVGGSIDQNIISDRCAYLDERTSTWVRLPSLSMPRFACAAAAQDNSLYVIGGATEYSPYTFVADFERLDLVTKRWSRLPQMPYAGDYPVAAWLRGKLYVLCGKVVNQTRSMLVQFYCPNLEEWTALAPVPDFEALCAATWNQRLYVVGGPAADNETVGRFLCFDTANWVELPNVPTSRTSGCALVPVAGELWVVGGSDHMNTGCGILYCIESYDPIAMNWTRRPEYTCRTRHAAVTLDSRLFILGGSFGADFPPEASEEPCWDAQSLDMNRSRIRRRRRRKSHDDMCSVWKKEADIREVLADLEPADWFGNWEEIAAVVAPISD